MRLSGGERGYRERRDEDGAFGGDPCRAIGRNRNDGRYGRAAEERRGRRFDRNNRRNRNDRNHRFDRWKCQYGRRNSPSR